MKIVIDIPEEIYNSLINGKNYLVYHWDVEDALRLGTPLPETAHWIKYQKPWGGTQGWKCSNCEHQYDINKVYTTMPYSYCPNCGKHMIEPQEGRNEK